MTNILRGIFLWVSGILVILSLYEESAALLIAAILISVMIVVIDLSDDL